MYFLKIVNGSKEGQISPLAFRFNVVMEKKK